MSADVSIIIPVYNAERYIERSIASALAQQDIVVEVIVVDDCSTDSTWNVLSKLTDPRIKPIRLAANQGPSGARNTAIATATAPWIAILDSDDVYRPGRLAQMLRLAGEKQADIIVDNLLVRREADGVEHLMFEADWVPPSGMLDLAHFIRSNVLFFDHYGLGYLKPVFSAAFLRRHALAYNPAISIGEDYLLLAEALACGGRCAIVPAANYLYTARAGSVTYRMLVQDLESLADADARLWTKYPLDPAAAKAQSARMRNLRVALGYTQLVAGIKQRDWTMICAALQTHPMALRHLWRPLWVRIQRLAQRCIGKAQPVKS